MSRSGSRRVVFSPDVNETPTVLLRSCTADRLATTGRYQTVVAAPAASIGGSFTHRVCRGAGHLPMRLFRYVGANVVRALCFISGCKSRRPPSSSSKVSPRTISKPFALPQEPHHTEAIEDCIKFINSSSRRSCWNSQPFTAVDEHLAHARALPTNP